MEKVLNKKRGNESSIKVILCAGGTGGHVFPALIIAQKLLNIPRIDVELMVDQRGSRYLGDWKGAVWPISIRQGHWGLRIFSVGYCTLKLWWQFMVNPPALVIGFGGYPAASGTLAALLSGIPYMIHEQNSVLGRVNRWMAPWARRVFLSFKKTLKVFWVGEKQKIVLPFPLVRAHFLENASEPVSLPRSFKKETPLRLLVIGGSQGSKALALYTKGMIEFLNAVQCAQIHITLQAPESVLKECIESCERLGVTFEAAPFFSSLPQLMGQSHLIMARSGASTVTEISLCGIPSVLIPLPSSASNHQFHNCDFLVEEKRAWRFEEKNTTPEALANFIKSLLKDPNLLNTKRAPFLDGKSKGYWVKDPGDAMVSEVDSFLKGLHKE